MILPCSVWLTTQRAVHACDQSPDRGILGDWYYPNGTGFANNGELWDFYRNRGPSVVRLNRRRDGVTGIYCCEIPDTTGVVQTIYIGVYTANTGGWCIYTQVLLLQFLYRVSGTICRKKVLWGWNVAFVCLMFAQSKIVLVICSQISMSYERIQSLAQGTIQTTMNCNIILLFCDINVLKPLHWPTHTGIKLKFV